MTLPAFLEMFALTNCRTENILNLVYALNNDLFPIKQVVNTKEFSILNYYSTTDFEEKCSFGGVQCFSYNGGGYQFSLIYVLI